MSDFSSFGIEVPIVLLPSNRVDLSRWAVIAADQYTSQLDYWERVDRRVGDAPSTLRLFLPEAYLGGADVADRIARIGDAMRDYEASGVFREPFEGFIYVDRATTHAPSRKGLIVAMDLECYDYRAGARSLVRATERTVEERLPPRVAVRQRASLELPHVMVLLDDPERTVIEPLSEVAQRSPLYDTELMEGGGHLRGYAVEGKDLLATLRESLGRLADPAHFKSRYGVDSDDVLLFAVGDGNHSLAAAKVHWEELKRTLPKERAERHPARYALVELVNVHDPGLTFEPIHRVVFGVDPLELRKALPAYFEKRGGSVEIREAGGEAEQRAELTAVWEARGAVQAFGFVHGQQRGVVRLSNPPSNLAVGSLQAFLDDTLHRWPGASIDYIHGADVTESLALGGDGRVGFFLPAMDKGDLFKTVLFDGALPRKTFSMGEAEEKRFYFEARRIVE